MKYTTNHVNMMDEEELELIKNFFAQKTSYRVVSLVIKNVSSGDDKELRLVLTKEKEIIVNGNTADKPIFHGRHCSP